MHFLVIGLGLTGRAAVEVLLRDGHTVTCCDRDPQQEAITSWLKTYEGLIKVYPEDASLDLKGIDKAILSPGIAWESPFVQKVLSHTIPIIGEAEFALSRIKKPCIGITGSNGKTTMTLFIAHLLRSSGVKAVALGNVGVPFSSYLLSSQEEDVCVCELSSYQLETLRAPCLDLAIILEITPDHMDRYPSFDVYAFAKFNMLKCLKHSGKAFVSYTTFMQFEKQITSLHPAVNSIPALFSQKNKNCYLQLRKTKEYCDFLPLIIEKALGVELLFLAVEVLKTFGFGLSFLDVALQSFKKPEHRLEFVDKLNEIAFYNDSKATNVESVVYAVKNLEKQIYLIVGGKDKNLCFDPWVEAFKDAVEGVFAIGECAKKIQLALEPIIKVEICATLEKALRSAFAKATPRSKILLSPGCASFDQFKDYRHRGECFKNYVTALKQEVV